MRPNQSLPVIVLLASIGMLDSQAASDAITHDFSTPEGAILALEDAYRTRHIEKVVRCKDFVEEARYMFRDKPQMQRNADIIAQTAEVLELSFRAEMKKKSLPNFTGVISTFPKKETLGDNRVIVTEVCRFPDGHSTTQKILVVKTARGWRALIPVK